ncbi:hypothetical protein [Lysinibacillus sp. G4S2]|nr:hypothetical protein [Lysinibacillus sp. G4S2]MDM5247683.1 hypothetical protein [Lysinibacillus sp. G4S2]
MRKRSDSNTVLSVRKRSANEASATKRVARSGNQLFECIKRVDQHT